MRSQHLHQQLRHAKYCSYTSVQITGEPGGDDGRSGGGVRDIGIDRGREEDGDDDHAPTAPRARGPRDRDGRPAICPNRAVRIPEWYHHGGGRQDRRDQVPHGDSVERVSLQQLDRLPRALLRGSLVNGSNRHRRGRPEKSWWSCLTDDLKVFEISEGGRETLAKDRSRWCNRVSQGTGVVMSVWKDNERKVALIRHARQAEKRALTLSPPRGRYSNRLFCHQRLLTSRK